MWHYWDSQVFFSLLMPAMNHSMWSIYWLHYITCHSPAISNYAWTASCTFLCSLSHAANRDIHISFKMRSLSIISLWGGILCYIPCTNSRIVGLVPMLRKSRKRLTDFHVFNILRCHFLSFLHCSPDFLYPFFRFPCVCLANVLFMKGTIQYTALGYYHLGFLHKSGTAEGAVVQPSSWPLAHFFQSGLGPLKQWFSTLLASRLLWKMPALIFQ